MALPALAQSPTGVGAKDDAVRKLTDEEKLTLIRGLAAEYAKVKVMLPRSGKAEELLARFGIDAAAIVKMVKALA